MGYRLNFDRVVSPIRKIFLKSNFFWKNQFGVNFRDGDGQKELDGALYLTRNMPKNLGKVDWNSVGHTVYLTVNCIQLNSANANHFAHGGNLLIRAGKISVERRETSVC